MGDITKIKVDAVVNAANNVCLGGLGVDGAIHKVAGRELFEECVGLRGCDTGDAKITKGYNLPAKHVIHAVGPIFFEYKPEEADKLLAKTYKRSLEVLVENNLHTIAFPSISTGYFKFPIERAIPTVFKTVLDFLEDHKEVSVTFVMWTEENLKLYNDYYDMIAKN